VLGFCGSVGNAGRCSCRPVDALHFLSPGQLSLRYNPPRYGKERWSGCIFYLLTSVVVFLRGEQKAKSSCPL